MANADRTLTIEAEISVYTVEAESRTIVIEAECRTVTVTEVNN